MEIGPGADPNYCDIHVDLTLAAGDLATWQRVVRTFLDDGAQAIFDLAHLGRG